MSVTSRTLTVILPVTGVTHYPDDSEWVCCLHCGQHLGLHQPESDKPERLIGTCAHCDHWYLLDWRSQFREGLMLLLPDHDDLLRSFG